MKRMIILTLLLAPSQAAIAQSQVAAEEPAAQDTTSSDHGVTDIIVTAQKREQSLNSVGMTVTAISGEGLKDQGVTNAADLVKVVPGFVYIETPTGSPVYTLRGVGYVDETLSAAPAVSVYVDEVPLPFSTMARAAVLDLARVEVLKGPQGTLFGENSTGGAFNYIAARPQDEFGAGFDLSYGRFNTFDAQGYITGPVAPDVNMRVAARMLASDDWQKSYTRLDTLGRTRQYQGRVLLDWQATDRLSVSFNVNGWVDRSDTQAPQLVAVVPQVPAALDPELGNYPLPPANNRAADWDPSYDNRRNDNFFQASMRSDYELSSNVTVTSITAYGELKLQANYDGDGTSLNDFDRGVQAKAHSFYQELRASGSGDSFNWVVGGNFSRSRADERLASRTADASNSEIFPGLPLSETTTSSDQKISSKAVFANLEFNLTPELTLKGGARYTKNIRRATNCITDTGNGNFALSFAMLADALNGAAPAPALAPGDCSSLDENFNPGAANSRLAEDNVAWRVGVDWQSSGGLLVYGNISRGYKAGTVGTTPTVFHAQNAPITQEKLTAYEAGFKAPLFDRTLQLNGAVFHYSYDDKQLLGRVLVPPFGLLFQLVNLPKSTLDGAELELNWRPVRGLSFNIASTYLKTEIKEFIGFDGGGNVTDFAGTGLPYSPKWQVNSNAEYEFPINNGLNGFVGGNLSYQSKSNAGFGFDPLLNIKGRTLLDVHVGVEHPDGKWSARLWGRNITNSYYWVSSVQNQDVNIRFAGRPATYGVSLSTKF